MGVLKQQTIDPEGVQAAFLDCLFTPEEVDGAAAVPIGAVVVEGILGKFGFHPGRLEGHRPLIFGWLCALPVQFQKSGGGGWSFLQACMDRDGEQWTGFHQRMDQLFCLGMGLNLVVCQLPREMWSVLPGGMPYYMVDDAQCKAAAQ